MGPFLGQLQIGCGVSNTCFLVFALNREGKLEIGSNWQEGSLYYVCLGYPLGGQKVKDQRHQVACYKDENILF